MIGGIEQDGLSRQRVICRGCAAG